MASEVLASYMLCTALTLLSASGNAPSQPSGGFNNTSLASIFAQRVPYTPLPTLQPPSGTQDNQTAQNTSGPDTTNLPASPGSSSSPNLGTVAGGVVGGVLGLALVAGTAFFFLRKRRRSNGVSRNQEQATSTRQAEVREADGAQIVEMDAANPKQRIEETPGDVQYATMPWQERLYELS